MKENFNLIWKILPNGDKERAFEIYTSIIEQEKETFDGEWVDHNYLVRKLKEYVEWWNNSFGKRDKKFVGKGDEKKTLSNWLGSSGWDETHIIDGNIKRDNYIFGSWDFPELQKKVKEFRETINGNKEKS